eukprot:8213569-Alexandrium_andersonii.AAC.1
MGALCAISRPEAESTRERRVLARERQMENESGHVLGALGALGRRRALGALPPSPGARPQA